MDKSIKNLLLQINPKIINILRAEGIQTDNMGSILIILFSLYEYRYDILDCFDDNNKERRSILMYRTLERKGLIEKALEEKVHYKLSEYGINLVSKLKNEFDVIEEFKDNEAEKILNLVELSDVSSWIREYIKIFPSGMYFGRYLRTNSKECIERMQWFIKEYGYGKDIILAATNLYISSQQSSYEYTRNSSYFIWKDDKNRGRISDLLTWCENVINSNSEEPKAINMDTI